ncbi:MAG TPA: WD40 repeat domain-containing protein, partial [Kofleriaceae bacterium]
VTADGARTRLTPLELRQRLAVPRSAAVLDKLVAARLIAMSKIEGEPHVEIIHDALLDTWPRLQRWIREDADGARMRDQLRTAARQWNDRVRPRGLLWRDDALAELERWLRRGKAIVLSELEAAFVEASRRVARHARIRRRLGLVAIGFAVAFAVFGYHTMQDRNARHVEEGRLTQVYADWGQEALLDGKSTEALIYLDLAARRGDDSPRVKFMLARAAEPLQHELARLDSTQGQMWWAMFSPDGQRIVTTDDRGARVWDARSMIPLFPLPHGDIVHQAAFTSDGGQIVTAGTDGSIKIWDANTGQLKTTLHPPASNDVVQYLALALSPRGTEVAAIDVTGGVVDVWDLRTGELVKEILDQRDVMKIPSIQFSHDSRWLAVSSGDDARVYDTASWKLGLTIAGPGIGTLSFDPTGSRLATATLLGDVSIWTVPGGVRAQHLRESGDKVNHVAFSPDGGFVVAAGDDGIDRIWNANTGRLQADLKNHHSAAQWAEFDPTSRLVVSADTDGTVAISDVMLGMKLSTLEGPPSLVHVAHFDPRSEHVIGASWDHTARVWDATWSYVRWATPPIGEDCGSAVRAEPDRRFLAVACAKHGTQVWDTADPARARLVAELPSPTLVPGDFLSPSPAITETGDRAAIATGRIVTIYELPGRRIVRTVEHAAPVTSVAFAASGHDLVTGSADGSLRIMRDGGDGFELARLPAAVDVAGFVPDGRVVVADARQKLGVYDVTHRSRLAELDLPGRMQAFRSAGDGHRLITIPTTGAVHPLVLWDLTSYPYEVIAKLDAHNAPVFSARFVQGDRQILTAGTDGTARLWDAATGRLLKSYLRSSPYLADAALDPSGAMVVTAGGDGVLRFWDASSARMLWTLRAHSSRIAGVHFEGTDLVTRGFTGEIARWRMSSPPDLAHTVDGIVRCLPLHFDEETGGLVEQDRRCDH